MTELAPLKKAPSLSLKLLSTEVLEKVYSTLSEVDKSKYSEFVDLNKIKILKNDGHYEDFNPFKLHRFVAFCIRGLKSLSESDIVLSIANKLVDGLSTKDLNNIVIEELSSRISKDCQEASTAASRGLLFVLRKAAYGKYKPPKLIDHVQSMIDRGFYDPILASLLSEKEWLDLENFVDHDVDETFEFASMVVFESRYLLQDRTTGQILETPMMAAIMRSVMSTAGWNYSKEQRIKEIKGRMQLELDKVLNIPTPVAVSLRTVSRQFASCTKIDIHDSIIGINSANAATLLYVSGMAGIGLNGGRLRRIGAKIGNGSKVHTGGFGFLKATNALVGATSAGGVRKGSLNINYPCWTFECEEYLVAKNAKGNDSNRIREADFTIHFNIYFINKMLNDETIYLMSAGEKECPGLYASFYKADESEFIELYEKYVADPKVAKKEMKGSTLLNKYLLQERPTTSRYYDMIASEVNRHSNFKKSVVMTNLCVEITLPTEPLYIDYDGKDEGLIALCNLFAVNVGVLNGTSDLHRLKQYMRDIVRYADDLLELQSYPHPAAKRHSLLYRPLGIGLTNFAYWLAKQGLKYGAPDTLVATHRLMEYISYYGILASIELAKERGACAGYKDTRWSDGELPIDHYKKTVDELVAPNYELDWTYLREQLALYGIRHSTLFAQMPCETSSTALNATNGVELPLEFVTVKPAKNSRPAVQLLPELTALEKNYELMYQTPVTGYIKTVCVIQKFMCQSMSTQFWYKPSNYAGNVVPAEVVINDWIEHIYYGGKTHYYHKTDDSSTSGTRELENSMLSNNPASDLEKLSLERAVVIEADPEEFSETETDGCGGFCML